MNRLLLVGAAGLIAAVANLSHIPMASADGTAPLPAAPPPPAPVEAAPQPNWTGGQAGGFGGGSQLNASFVEPGSNLCPGPYSGYASGVSANYSGCRETLFDFDNNKTVFTGGLLAGYRWQMGAFVAGLEADVAFKGSTKESRAIHPITTVYNAGGNNPHIRSEHFTGKVSQSTDASLRARLGVLVGPSVLAYATGGLAFGRVCGHFSYAATIDDSSYNNNNTSSYASASGQSNWCNTRVGYTAGGGVEVALHRGWKARVEYRYTDLGTYHRDTPLAVHSVAGATCGSAGFNCAGKARVDIDTAFHTLRFGIAYDFMSPL